MPLVNMKIYFKVITATTAGVIGSEITQPEQTPVGPKDFAEWSVKITTGGTRRSFARAQRPFVALTRAHTTLVISGILHRHPCFLFPPLSHFERSSRREVTFSPVGSVCTNSRHYMIRKT